MKKLWILIVVLIFMLGCSSSNHLTETGLTKSKVYVGMYTGSIIVNDKYTFIMTSQGMFKIKDNPLIPDSTWCYVRIQETSWDMHPDIAKQMQINFFTWKGSDREYRVYNDIKMWR